MRHRLDPRALEDFEAAVEYYLRLSPEAASMFVDEFEAAVAFVSQNPAAAALIDSDVRRWNFRRFPYALLYRLIDERVVILGVMHARRDPKVWKARTR